MVPLRIVLLANIILCFIYAGYGQKTSTNLVFKFTKTDLEKIFYNDNKELKVDFFIEGLTDKKAVKELKKNSLLKGIEIPDFPSEKTPATFVFQKNIDAFRNILEKNNVSYIFCNEIKIKTSNIITQSKALELSKDIIDIKDFKFDESCNKADNLRYYEYHVYYFETKLFSDMHNYYSSLFNGYIEKAQESLRNAKDEKDEFIQQYSK